MPKEIHYSLAQIFKNLFTFYKKIKIRNMDENFWVIADRSDFQPLKRTIKSQNKMPIPKITKANSKKKSKKNSKIGSKAGSKTGSKAGSKTTIKKVNIRSIKELKDNFLEGKGEYYKDKKFANIKITVNESVMNKMLDVKNYKEIKNEPVVTVQVIMFRVSSSGYLNFNEKTELKVKYMVDDFRNINFKLKNIEVLMRLLADSVIKTNSSTGITYKTLLEKINHKQK